MKSPPKSPLKINEPEENTNIDTLGDSIINTVSINNTDTTNSIFNKIAKNDDLGDNSAEGTESEVKTIDTNNENSNTINENTNNSELNKNKRRASNLKPFSEGFQKVKSKKSVVITENQNGINEYFRTDEITAKNEDIVTTQVLDKDDVISVNSYNGNQSYEETIFKRK